MKLTGGTLQAQRKIDASTKVQSFKWVGLIALVAFAIVLIRKFRAQQNTRKNERRSKPLERKTRNLETNQNFLPSTTGGEEIVTVMFIDVASFSLIAQEQSPREVFASLKSLLTILSDTVVKHGGKIDRTIGDGMLCFFSSKHDTRGHNHVDRAIGCALAIQRASLQRTMDSKRSDHPIFPLRIGINTASVYFGNLGDQPKMDITLIGNGVNFAKRLEDACDHYSIMLSKTTLDLSSQYNMTTPCIRKRHVPIKHHQELVEAVECDPFHGSPDLRELALELYRERLHIVRKNERFQPSKRRIEIPTNYGPASLVDYSLTGLAISLPIYLARGAGIKIQLDDTPTSAFIALKNRYALDSIMTEVRWGRPGRQKNEYIHGIAIKNLSDSQLDALFSHLNRSAKTRSEPLKIA